MTQMYSIFSKSLSNCFIPLIRFFCYDVLAMIDVYEQMAVSLSNHKIFYNF